MSRVRIVGLAFMVELATWCWLPMASADDRATDPQVKAELAARKRILANWQARQERIKSFYVAWKAGPNDRPPKWARASLPGVHQLWVASDGRFREEFPSFAFGRNLAVAHQQRAFDGKYLRALWTPLKINGPDGTPKKVPVGCFPSGNVRTLKDPDERRRYGQGGAEMLAFRPLQSPFGDWTLENSRVTTQNAVVGRSHYVKIEKFDAQSGITEACWVDPRRDDLVIHFEREFGTGSEDWTSLEYKQDPRHVWVLIGWQNEFRNMNEQGMRKSKSEAIVTEYKINDDFPSGTFQIKFPAGAVVHDHDSKRDYFVRRDGSQRTIDRIQLGDSAKYEQLLNGDSTRAAKP